MKSAFAAKQLLFAHAALTDLQNRRFLHDQRVAREGFGLADAATEDTGLKLRDWTLKRSPGDALAPYETRIKAADFELALTLTPTQPVLLQGQQGLSRKGPDASQASFYYSQPQLRVQGAVTTLGVKTIVQGRAWLDHEWSESLLHPQAVGWDWIGMNLDDGSALTAFRLRTAQGQTLWAGGSFRAPEGVPRIFKAEEVIFTPLKHWRSAQSGATYPVEWQVSTPAGSYKVVAAMHEQELDSRNSTGAIYWEGLSRLTDMQGRTLGSGYLEMTGYAQALRL
jgi:predicted secreted hydrolase